MTDYTELVKALRIHTTLGVDCDECSYYDDCRIHGNGQENMIKDAAAAIEALQAEVKRLKECNDELREAQTYIDHYGDKWMTSAKDVPTSAYNHGYMDGKNEAEQALEPKRGEWIVKGANRIDCSVCGHSVCFAFGLSEGSLDLYKYCPECGAKMEVQE